MRIRLRWAHCYVVMDTRAVAFGVLTCAVLVVGGWMAVKPSVSANPGTRLAVNVANDILLGLTKREQAVALGVVVGEGCSGNRAFFMGISPEDQTADWSVGCRNGASYELGIKPDAKGTTSFIECAILKAVAGVRCFVALDDQTNDQRSREQMKADLNRLPPHVRRQLMERFRASVRRSLDPTP